MQLSQQNLLLQQQGQGPQDRTLQVVGRQRCRHANRYEFHERPRRDLDTQVHNINRQGAPWRNKRQLDYERRYRFPGVGGLAR